MAIQLRTQMHRFLSLCPAPLSAFALVAPFQVTSPQSAFWSCRSPSRLVGPPVSTGRTDKHGHQVLIQRRRFCISSPCLFISNEDGDSLDLSACKNKSKRKSDDYSQSKSILFSIRNSLRYDLVQPHLDAISFPTSSQKGLYPNPTLVLVLAVSGGCDSIGLFYSILDLTVRNNDDYDECESSNASVETNNNSPDEKDDNIINRPPFWLLLGEDDALNHATTIRRRKRKHKDSFRVPCEIHVAHFNHEQRGENSDGDETLVHNLCRERGIPFHTYSWSKDLKDGGYDSPTIKMLEDDDDDDDDDADISELPYDGQKDDPEAFTQDTARKWRQRRLLELLSETVKTEDNPTYDESGTTSRQRWGAILTAHHRDDADETILLKLLRGSHLTNLKGMEPRSNAFDLCTSQNADAKMNNETHLGYFAKPMLGVRKNDIVEYLVSNSLEWREDESNSSNKYKRNKVRNELMPLLCEIAGGEQALQRRFSNLEQQSRDISRDLTKRAEYYLSSMADGPNFLLPKPHDSSNHQFELVEQEAFHLWITRVTESDLQMTYDQMLRIRDQIHSYPDRLQWTMDIGDSWKVQRNGDALTVLNNDGVVRVDHADRDNCFEESNFWRILRMESNVDEVNSSGDSSTGIVELFFSSIPYRVDLSTLTIKKVKDVGSMKFVPPWRRGRSPVKVKEFLRGQKIPLHRRDDALVVCSSKDSLSDAALAVYLEDGNGEGSGKWIVHADFEFVSGMAATKVILQKT